MKPPNDLGFVHIFMPAEKPNSRTLLLLHGTGGDEHDLLELGRQWWPGAALLGVRGKVLENGMPRFFRRFAAEHYGFGKRHLVVVGHSFMMSIPSSYLE